MSLTVIFIIAMVGISLYAGGQPHLQDKLLMNPYRVAQRKEYYRFITSGFVHGGYIHLFFNCFAFYFFGENVEYVFTALFGVFGKPLFALLFLLGIVVSDIPTYLKHREHPHYNALGASGGVSAVIFSSILFIPTAPICLYAVLCLPGFILGTIYLIYSYHSSKSGGDGINHSAHFYGAAFGMAFTILLKPTVVLSFIDQIANWRWEGLF